ncbi:hypothetical protein EV200_105372 [Pedobacter psychrotolerans]|uniref:Dolichol-P-glucose synthetase n=2 Tax=Pedobacter psychrotolerans TaxID=1843235 RepID=A0A4R2HA29_9SPHI|nr:hypothetical protein EV200_105372 [Pedobacter psychrotolerans]GGE63453.1 dolichol-P-glucose synthetase [Pedobacter psychrotolerans]
MFLIGMGILYLAFRGQDLFKIWQEIKTAKLYYVAISSFSAWLAYVLRALRWQMLYRSIHYEVGFSTAYHAVMIGYLANLALPRFGEIVRCSAIHKTTKVPIFASLGTVITERLFDVLVLLLGGLALFIFQYDLVSNFLQNIIYHHIEEKLKQINYRWLLILGSFLISIIGILIYILRRKVGKKFLRIFVSLRQGFGSYSKMKRKRKFLLYTIGIWSLYLLSMYLCFSALAVTKNMPIDAAFTALIFSGFAMAAPVQGGIGVFHWMVGQSLVLYSISFKDGLAYATIIHSSQVLIILVLGSISLFRMIASHKKELGTHH